MTYALIALWLIGGVYWFNKFNQWGAEYCVDHYDTVFMLFWNFALSLIWFLYVPLYLYRKE
jgi:hypothetical protein